MNEPKEFQIPFPETNSEASPAPEPEKSKVFAIPEGTPFYTGPVGQRYSQHARYAPAGTTAELERQYEVGGIISELVRIKSPQELVNQVFYTVKSWQTSNKRNLSKKARF